MQVLYAAVIESGEFFQRGNLHVFPFDMQEYAEMQWHRQLVWPPLWVTFPASVHLS